ncbi:MAG TPA: FtsX-like permease family protein [Candidatus Acidoferrales bacterium]|nr:FtsX-like permease family protein [Candidatus Acidoferrales bacterium]
MTSSGEFTYWQLIWCNLRARPLRTGLSVIAVAIQVVLVLLIVGMIDGVVSEWGQRVEGVGADLLVRPPNSSIFVAFSSASMLESLGAELKDLPRIDVVSPVLVMMDTRAMDVVYGIDYRSFNDLSSGFKFLAGGPFRGTNDVIVDDIKAQTKHLKVGEQLTLLNRNFTICGIVQNGKGARLFVPLTTAQAMSGAEGKVSMFYVRSTGDTEMARQNLLKLLPDYRIFSMQEYLTLMNSSHLPELEPFINSMTGLGIGISFLVVLLATYTIVLERTHEIGVLKSLGASRAQVVGLLLKETLIMAALGIVLGLAVTWMTRAVLHRSLPTLTILISGIWIAKAVVLAVAAAMLGAVYPALRAARYDPVDALAHE